MHRPDRLIPLILLLSLVLRCGDPSGNPDDLAREDLNAKIYCHVYKRGNGEPLDSATVVHVSQNMDSTCYDVFTAMTTPGKYSYEKPGNHPAGDVVIIRAGYYADTLAVPGMEAGDSTSLTAYLGKIPAGKEGFYITTATDRQIYHLQDTVGVTVTAVNNTDTTFIRDLNSGCTLIYAVLDDGDQIKYGITVCTHIFSRFTLEPHQTEQEYFEWNLGHLVERGYPVPPGLYKVFGRLGNATVVAGDTVNVWVLN